MKARQLALVLVVLVALGAVALLLRNRNAASWSSSATATADKIVKFPLNDVSHVTLKDSTSELNLVKTGDVWTVQERFGYPADFDKVARLIRRVWETRPTQDVKVGRSQLGRLQLTEPGKEPNSGLLIELKENGKKRLAALVLGKKHVRESDQSFGSGIPAGRYVMGLNGTNRAFLISETFDDVENKPEQWLSRDFIKVERPKSIALTGATPGMNWKIIKDNESAPWKFVDAKRGEELDVAKASGLAAAFATPSFSDVADPKSPPATTGLDKPVLVRIETFDNFSYELRIGKLTGDNYPVLITVAGELPKERAPAKDEKPEDKASLDKQFQAKQTQLKDKLAQEKKCENWPYLMTKATIDQVLKDRGTLLPEKKPSPSPAVATSPGPATTPPAQTGSPRQPPPRLRPRPR